ncbi:hypothetical protein QUF75_00995 [Desulfococcaceae bacterium HSG7]|nr:hypothetical protein [Desulfococcaceae bacterium HSG7]
MLSKQGTSQSGNYEISGAKSENGHRQHWTKVIFRTILPVAVLAAGVASGLWLMETRPHAKPRPRIRNAALVECMTVDYSPQQTIISSMGTVTAARNVELKPQVSGEIMEISGNLIPGGYFRQGETLLKIDLTDYRLTMRGLAANVAKARSDLQIEQGNQLVAQKEY